MSLRVVQARRRVRDLVDRQPWYIWRLCPHLRAERVLPRVVDVLVVLVALRGIGRILLERMAIVKTVVAVRLHLPLCFHHLVVARDFEAEVRLRRLLLAVLAVNDLALLCATRDVRVRVLQQVQTNHLRRLDEEVAVLKQGHRVRKLLLVAIVEIVVEV